MVTDIYWPELTPNGLNVYRRDMEHPSVPPQHQGAYPISNDQYYHTDQTGTYWRLWRVDRQPVNLSSPGIDRGRKAAATVGDSVKRIASINDINKKYWGDK